MFADGWEDVKDLELVAEEEVIQPFSVCPKHGYLNGDYFRCPYCDEEK